jgi:hypothetical protein
MFTPEFNKTSSCAKNRIETSHGTYKGDMFLLPANLNI